MTNISSVFGGGGMIVLGVWWYYRYQKTQQTTSVEDMWHASKVMSVVAIGLFVWVALLVWGLQ